MVKLFEKYEYPRRLHYSKDHLWLKVEGRRVRVGLTDFSQQMAGRIRFVRLRPIGKRVEKGKTLVTMETGKWVGSLVSPISGTIVKNNRDLRRKAALVNEDPYRRGGFPSSSPQTWRRSWRP